MCLTTHQFYISYSNNLLTYLSLYFINNVLKFSLFIYIIDQTTHMLIINIIIK